jgi:hypothetical protein
MKIVEYRKRAQALTVHYNLPEMTQVRGAAVFSVAYYGAVTCQDYEPIATRSEILDFVDEAKRQELIPWRLRKECLFTVSIYGIKVTDLAGRDPPFMREDLHAIASVCGAEEEENSLTLLIKTGTPEQKLGKCHVLEIHADSVSEILSLIQHTITEAFKHAHPLASPAPIKSAPQVDSYFARKALEHPIIPPSMSPPTSPLSPPRKQSKDAPGSASDLLSASPAAASPGEFFVEDEQVVVQLRSV